MPWDVIKRDCKQADGSAGSAVVVKVKSDGGTEQESCHTSEEKAQAAVRARHASKNEEVSLKITRRQLRAEIRNALISEDLQYHIDHGVGVDKNIHRPGSDAFFALFREAKELSDAGMYELNESERELLEGSDLGKFGYYEGERVPLDYPMLYEDELDEAEYKGKKVDLNKPKRGGGKGKAYVFVNSGKKNRDGTIRVKRVRFGSSMPDAMGNSEVHKKRRKSFGDRHNCADKKDKTKPGYWSCRATKFFGRNIAGWW